MPRRVSRRRLAVAVVLLALSVLPNVIHVHGSAYNPVPNAHLRPDNPKRPVVCLMFLGGTLTYFDVSSVERARWIRYRWEQYRRYSWVLALLAGFIVVREFLPIPRLFGRE